MAPYGILVWLSHDASHPTRIKRVFHTSSARARYARYAWYSSLFASLWSLHMKHPEAYRRADQKKMDGRRVLVDVERGRTVKGWRPRRLGMLLSIH